VTSWVNVDGSLKLTLTPVKLQRFFTKRVLTSLLLLLLSLFDLTMLQCLLTLLFVFALCAVLSCSWTLSWVWGLAVVVMNQSDDDVDFWLKVWDMNRRTNWECCTVAVFFFPHAFSLLLLALGWVSKKYEEINDKYYNITIATTIMKIQYKGSKWKYHIFCS